MYIALLILLIGAIIAYLYKKNTLPDPSIRVNSWASGKSYILNPDDTNNLVKITPNADTVTSDDSVAESKRLAWLTPYFYYPQWTLPEIMRDLKKWYGFSCYIFEKGVDTTSHCDDCTWKISRKSELSTVLQRLEKQDRHFRLEGTMVIVSK